MGTAVKPKVKKDSFELVLSGSRWLIKTPASKKIIGVYTNHTTKTGPPSREQCLFYARYWNRNSAVLNGWAIWNGNTPKG